MCWTITMGTGKSRGKVGIRTARALGPPVDTPIATISIRSSPRGSAKRGEIALEIGVAGAAVGRHDPKTWLQIPLIFGISSVRIRSNPCRSEEHTSELQS